LTGDLGCLFVGIAENKVGSAQSGAIEKSQQPPSNPLVHPSVASGFAQSCEVVQNHNTRPETKPGQVNIEVSHVADDHYSRMKSTAVQQQLRPSDQKPQDQENCQDRKPGNADLVRSAQTERSIGHRNRIAARFQTLSQNTCPWMEPLVEGPEEKDID
jgi:hypothetical protein